MWTVFYAKLVTKKTEDSNPEDDENNFANLINDLHDKLKSIQHGRGASFHISDMGSLIIIGDGGTTITLNKGGNINVTVQSM